MTINARLEDLQPNPLQVSLNELMRKADEMAKYYLWGFGGTIRVIAGRGVDILEGLVSVPVDEIYSRFDKIKKFYGKLKADNLHDKEFCPLVVVKDLLPHFEKSMGEVYKERRKECNNDLIFYGNAIMAVGNIYRKNLRRVLEDIHSFPEGKDFKINIVNPFDGLSCDTKII